jgi:FO synthase
LITSNPERPWPVLEELRIATEAAGHTLAPRLTIYPEYTLEPQRWLDEAMHFRVLDRSDAEGLGAVLAERAQQATNVGDGAEVILAGRRFTAWYSSTDVTPPALLPAQARAIGAVELVTLLSARGHRIRDQRLAPWPGARQTRPPHPGSRRALSETAVDGDASEQQAERPPVGMQPPWHAR